LLLKIQKTKQVGVKIKAGKDNIKGNLQPELQNWIVTPQNIPFSFEKGMEQILF
jgi:hypothetical protein